MLVAEVYAVAQKQFVWSKITEQCPSTKLNSFSQRQHRKIHTRSLVLLVSPSSSSASHKLNGQRIQYSAYYVLKIKPSYYHYKQKTTNNM